MHRIDLATDCGGNKFKKGKFSMKIRKKISEIAVLSGEQSIPLSDILDKYVANALDEVEITLSDDEMYEVYQAQQERFRLRDAQDHFDEFVFGADPEALDEARVEQEKQRFQERYGFSYDEAVDPKSEHYVLGEAARRFRNKYDCEIDENTQWKIAIEYLLEDIVS